MRPCYEAAYGRQAVRDLMDQIAEPGKSSQEHGFSRTSGVTSRDMERYSSFLEAADEPQKGDRIWLLDAGAGVGEVSWWLSEHTDYDVIAIDFAIMACKQGTARLSRSETLRFAAADMCRLPFATSSFSAIVAIDSLYLTPNPDAALGELARVARPGAALIFTVLWQTVNEQNRIVSAWTNLLEQCEFRIAACTDTSAGWRAQMHQRHGARWAKREQIRAALGAAALAELAVSRTMLGVGGLGPTIDSTRRTEFLARRSRR